MDDTERRRLRRMDAIERALRQFENQRYPEAHLMARTAVDALTDENLWGEP